MKTIDSTAVAYMRAVKAAALIPVRDKDTNIEYLKDLDRLGLERADYPTAEYDEPIRPSAAGKLDGWDGGYFTPNSALLGTSDDTLNQRHFHWVCSALGKFTPGHLIISGPSPCVGAVTAVLQIEQWLYDNRRHWFSDHWDHKTHRCTPEESYREAHQEFWVSLFNDLREHPDRHPHIIIEGSE